MVQKIKFFLQLLLVCIPGIFVFLIFKYSHAGEINLDLRMYGRVAMIYLTLALLISPLALYISDRKNSVRFISLRKLFGLAGFYFYLIHAYQYIAMEYGYHTGPGFIAYLSGNILARPDALSGVVAGMIMLVLWLTSNQFSLRILSPKVWKTVQSLAYPLFLLTLIHIAFASRFETLYSLLIIVLISVRTLAYFSSISSREKNGNKTLWRCIPCGYIYDEDIGDPDSGVLPGTRFEDIPDSWRCPVCGVTKADFEKIRGDDVPTQSTASNNATIVSAQKLTPDVIELVLLPEMPIISRPGQFVTLGMKDEAWEFHRSYSIVENTGGHITLAIKLKPDGRGSKAILQMNPWEKLKIAWAYGKFLLQNTSALCVGIATGTGLSPIIAFLASAPEREKILYIGAQTEKDLFYSDRLARIPNLEIHTYLSREDNPKYQSGRVDTSIFTYPLDTEFYICGNPALISESERVLREKGYSHIYYESFTV